MNNLVISNFQDHPFHLVSSSLWPLYISISLLVLTSAILAMHIFTNKTLSIKTVFAFLKDYSKNNVNSIPKPYKFTTKTIESNIDISQIVTEVGSLMPQLSLFITQFNSVVTENDINVVTDVVGNMSIDVPSTMSDELANNLSKRLGIIDRLITHRGQEINELFQKAFQIEKDLKIGNPDYVSPLTEKINEFKRLNSLYKH